jgi:hypothetical protein
VAWFAGEVALRSVVSAASAPSSARSSAVRSSAVSRTTPLAVGTPPAGAVTAVTVDPADVGALAPADAPAGVPALAPAAALAAAVALGGEREQA